MAQKRRQPEIIAGRVNADGSIAAGDGFTVNKIGTGNYVVTFPASFRPVGSSASTAGANGQASTIYGFDGPTSFRTGTVNTTGVASDMAFSFVAVGVQQ